jgi:hypothetical protein
MPAYKPEVIADCINRGRNVTLSAKARGDALEDLICHLLEAIPGVVVSRNQVDYFKSMEVDVVAGNAKQAAWMALLPDVFLVECKNWNDAVDSASVTEFASKLRYKGISLGVLVAANGITGNKEDLTSAHFRLAIEQSEGRRVLVVSLEDINSLTTSEEFVELLRDTFLRLVGSGKM